MRTSLSLVLVAVLASSAYAQGGQDIVKLKNGKYLSGTVVIDESDKDGFKVKRWDTGGCVYVKWTQVAEVERRRLLNKPADTGPTGELMAGVRIITSGQRDLTGILVKETELEILVKTKDNVQPTMVPKQSIISRTELKIREADAYGPDEMVERRVKTADPKDAARLIEIGQFAESLKLYSRAKDLYNQALAADASIKEKVDGLLAHLEELRKELEAAKKLADIRKLTEEGKYEEAIAEAEKFLSDYADTKAGKENKELLAQLKKEKEEYLKNRGEVLAKKVPEAWKSLRSSLLAEAAKNKKFSEARTMAGRIDEELQDKLSKKFNCPPEDVVKAWERREPKKRTVGMGTGSWINKGGQDGGMDYEGGGADNAGQTAMDDFTRRFGGKKKPDQQKDTGGRKLDTSEDWWKNASSTNRQDWLETEYVLNSSFVKKDSSKEEKNCSYCQGNGTVKATRLNQNVDVICPRCHKAKVDVSVTYW